MVRTQSHDTDPVVEARLLDRDRRMAAVEQLAHVGALGCMAEPRAPGGLDARYLQAAEAENRLRLPSRRVERTTLVRLCGWDPEVEGHCLVA